MVTFYLVDSTWGAGICEGEVFKPEFKDFYFCTDPNILVRSHLPADPNWQLLSTRIALDEFIN